MYDKTITLYNRYYSKSGTTWYPTVIENVDLTMDKASIIAKYGATSTDSASLHVRYKKDNGNKIIAGKKYMPPKEWSAQVNDDLANTITFNDNAERFDFFVLGARNTTPVLDDDYLDGYYNYINKKEDYCYAITSVGGDYPLIPHFEVLAK